MQHKLFSQTADTTSKHVNKICTAAVLSRIKQWWHCKVYL